MNRNRFSSLKQSLASPHRPTHGEHEHRTGQLLNHTTQLPHPLAPAAEPARDPIPESMLAPPRVPAPQPSSYPQLDQAALHGLAGRIIRTLAPHTEAHPAAILLQLLTAFGNIIGPGPHCVVGATRHALNLFAILVGDSSKARKGSSWNLIAALFAQVDPPWLSTRVNTARLAPGGLVQLMRDQQPPTDRRLLALSEEFATVLHSLKRGNGQLSPLLRSAWDHGNLPTLNMHQSVPVTGTHISLIAHITQHELTRTFPRDQAHNGFANRCLWTCVERSNCLPHGSNPPAHELSAAAVELRRALEWATATPAICFHRDREANQLWEHCYAALSYHQPGIRGAATSRGEAQVLRLSAIYAALDSSETVCLPHLQAAYAVWTYCYASASRLFGLSTGDEVADRIREALEAAPDGLTRNQVRLLFSGHVESDRIEAALGQLTAFGAIDSHTTRTKGRPSIRWAAVANPQSGESQTPEQPLTQLESASALE